MKQKHHSHSSFISRLKGFTLIELLIAIAIIGVLTTLLMTNFVGVRQRARDAQRKADIRQLQSALELYRADQGRYPALSGTAYRLNSSTVCPTSQSLQVGTTVYMSKIPCDSLGASVYNSGNYYYYTSTNFTYTLAACLENANDNDTSATTTAPSPTGGSCPSAKYFVVTNP